MALIDGSLALLLSTPVEHANLDTMLGLSRAALDAGLVVHVYLIDAGVTALTEPRVRELNARGVRLYACAYGCRKHRVALDDPENVTYCGLVTLAELIRRTDRFVALN